MGTLGKSRRETEGSRATPSCQCCSLCVSTLVKPEAAEWRGDANLSDDQKGVRILGVLVSVRFSFASAVWFVLVVQPACSSVSC